MNATTGDDVHETVTVIRCGDPCGSKRSLALFLASTEYPLPDPLTHSPLLLCGGFTPTPFSPEWDSRDREPPDPPPRLLS